MILISEKEDERREWNFKYCLLSFSNKGLKLMLNTFPRLKKKKAIFIKCEHKY